MRKADDVPPICAVVTKSEKLNFLEPSGPLRACNESDLPLPFTGHVMNRLDRRFARDDFTTLHEVQLLV